MAYLQQANFGTLLSSPGSAVTGGFLPLGSALSNPIAIMVVKNGTNGDVILSDDGVNNKFGFPAGTSTTYNFSANQPHSNDFFYPANRQLFVKQGASIPSTGTFYVEIVYVTPASGVV